MIKISFHLNGENVTVAVNPKKSLADILNQDLGIESIKNGCGKGQCGSCLVMMDDELVNSCLVPGFKILNKSIYTIEGKIQDNLLISLENSFKDYGPILCDLCRPGITMAITSLLGQSSNPTEKEIINALYGNACCCSPYKSIISVIKKSFLIKGK